MYYPPKPAPGQLWERIALHEPRLLYVYELSTYQDGSERWMWVKLAGVGSVTGGMNRDALIDMYRRVL